MLNEILLGTLALGGLYFATSSKKENYFSVPGVGDVPESQLPALGYIKYNGYWFKQSDVAAAAAANGATQAGTVDVNSQLGWNIFLTLMNTSSAIISSIVQNNTARIQDLVQQIMTKYTAIPSTNYNPNFPFTRAQLEKLTIKKLEQVLAGNFNV